jgi:[ribosomal protein S5]-alanine N-acetyltransferase
VAPLLVGGSHKFFSKIIIFDLPIFKQLFFWAPFRVGLVRPKGGAKPKERCLMKRSMATTTYKTTLQTDRLTLQPLMNTDALFIKELVNTDGWLKFIGNRNVNNEEDAIAYIQRINANENVVYWTVRPIGSDQNVGIITFIKRDYLDHRDIGFAFLPSSVGKGYAFEAAQKVLQYLVEGDHLDRILATTIPDNISSIKLLHKLGLTFDKEIKVGEETLHLYQARFE